MPSLQEIEKFKATLNSLGQEAELLAERGEAIEDLPPPESGPPDLGDLFAGVEAGEEAPPAPKAGSGAPEAGEEDFDFSSLFGVEGTEGMNGLAGPDVEEASGETAPALAAPDIPEVPSEPGPAAGDDAAAEQALQEFGIPPGLLDTLGETPAAEEDGVVEAPVSGEKVTDFALPADFSIHEEVGEPVTPEAEEAAVPAELPEPAEAPAGEEAILPEDFFSIGAAEAAPAGAEPFAEEPGGEALEFPAEFGEEAFPAAEVAAPEFTAPEAAEVSAPSPEEPSFEFPEAPTEGLSGLAELPADFADVGLFGEAEAAAAEAAPAEAREAAAPAAATVKAPPAAEPVTPPRARPPAPAGDEDFNLTERRFAALKRTLAMLPRNLKMAVEELVAEKGLTGPDLRLLTNLLADRAVPIRIAEEVSRITGQHIRLPRGYEKIAGITYEEEVRTFRYALRENIWPILRVSLLSIVFLGLLSFLGYRYIYRPLYANALYRQGHAQVLKDRYKLGEERFAKANAIIRFKGWYLRYAAAYASRRQYPLAADKYELLLQHFPLDRQGTLRYADLLTYSLFGYERAERILGDYIGDLPVTSPLARYVPKNSFKDQDILLARGDNYLEWAVEKPEHYENARLQYASILDYYGEQDKVLVRMMRYFMRVKPPRLKETRDLYKLLEEKAKLEVPAELYASVYSELAGFWFDQGVYEDVRDALLKAMKRQKFHPELHYQLARYYRYLQDPVEEQKALANAINLLEEATPRTKQRLLALIDSYNRLGEAHWRKKEYLDAEKNYQRAIDRIQNAQRQRILGLAPELGRAYKNRGDLYYYVSRDLPTALELYRQAEENLFRGVELDYQVGYIEYAQENYEPALLRFSRVVDSRPTSENALYALANTLYRQGYYSSAQGYYLRLLDLLELRRDRVPFLQPAQNSEHRDLLEFLMKTHNDLGVTYMRLGERSRDPVRQARALANLTFSSEYYDLLTRDPDTAERALTRNLAYLNQRAILYPTRPFELQLYGRLPVDLETPRF